ncbi:MAG: hypothetical protein WBD53_02975 [Xanthobacteraceae bacterium]
MAVWPCDGEAILANVCDQTARTAAVEAHAVTKSQGWDGLERFCCSDASQFVTAIASYLH